MQNLTEIVRSYDYSIYTSLYHFGQDYLFFKAFFYFFAQYGIVLFLLSFTYLIWMKKINAFLCSFIAMALAGLVDLLIVLVWRRPRPFVSHDLMISSIGNLQTGRFSSFPSSHTYIVFAIATSVYLYGHKKLGTTLFLLAIFVAMGRIGTGLHYPSDTIAGAILGIISGIIAYWFVRNNEKYWEYNDNQG
jgi:undecaprenyl-diphosphatase